MEPISSSLVESWGARLKTASKDAQPRYLRLALAIRDDVLAGRLAPGTKLPASRELSKALSISRNTVVGAYDLLTAEGVVDGRVGDGTRIAAKLPADSAPFADAPPIDKKKKNARPGDAGPKGVGLYSPGIPDLTLFPFDIWARLSGRVWRHDAATLALARDVRGYGPLRQEIASYLGPSRGVVTPEDGVMIVSGAQQALDLICRTLLSPGDQVVIENPSFRGLAPVLRAAGAQAIALPTDQDGLRVDLLEALDPAPKLVIVSPSRIYPTGGSLSLTRRLALLDWAQRTDAWIVEDDYDSDFRYDGPPLSSLHGLDKSARTIYIGTFSKVLFPAIRLGYMVPPKDMMSALCDIRQAADGCPATGPQAVLASFYAEGHLQSHIKRARRAYGMRRRALIQALTPALGDQATITAADGGMHVCIQFTTPTDDRLVADRLSVGGLGGDPLSPHFHGQSPPTGLVLGFAAHPAKALVSGVEQLIEVIWPD